jgi:predicted nucleic acid-binding protein
VIVVDASVAVKWFVKEDGHEAALGLLAHAHLSAPDLVFAETANVLWKKLRRNRLRASSPQIAPDSNTEN